jgi:hypothetical protein
MNFNKFAICTQFLKAGLTLTQAKILFFLARTSKVEYTKQANIVQYLGLNEKTTKRAFKKLSDDLYIKLSDDYTYNINPLKMPEPLKTPKIELPKLISLESLQVVFLDTEAAKKLNLSEYQYIIASVLYTLIKAKKQARYTEFCEVLALSKSAFYTHYNELCDKFNFNPIKQVGSKEIEFCDFWESLHALKNAPQPQPPTDKPTLSLALSIDMLSVKSAFEAFFYNKYKSEFTIFSKSDLQALGTISQALNTALLGQILPPDVPKLFWESLGKIPKYENPLNCNLQFIAKDINSILAVTKIAKPQPQPQPQHAPELAQYDTNTAKTILKNYFLLTELDIIDICEKKDFNAAFNVVFERFNRGVYNKIPLPRIVERLKQVFKAI